VRGNNQHYKTAPYALWDFAYPNSLTTESVPQDKKGRMQWFLDGGHYTQALGDLVLKKILGFPASRSHPDFGKRLL
jgi:hypothetical protein